VCQLYFVSMEGFTPQPCAQIVPRPAFLAVLAVVTECGMNNLQILREGWGFKSPSPHHRLPRPARKGLVRVPSTAPPQRPRVAES
jgi:hypothetical protein